MKNLFASFCTIVELSILPHIVRAESSINTPTKVLELMDKIGNWMYGILLALAVIFIILSAYNFLFSGGDEARVKTARQQLFGTVIAVAVAILAKSIIELVKFALA
jgi:hypothetical protein